MYNSFDCPSKCIPKNLHLYARGLFISIQLLTYWFPTLVQYWKWVTTRSINVSVFLIRLKWGRLFMHQLVLNLQMAGSVRILFLSFEYHSKLVSLWRLIISWSKSAFPTHELHSFSACILICFHQRNAAEQWRSTLNFIKLPWIEQSQLNLWMFWKKRSLKQ